MPMTHWKIKITGEMRKEDLYIHTVVPKTFKFGIMGKVMLLPKSKRGLSSVQWIL